MTPCPTPWCPVAGMTPCPVVAGMTPCPVIGGWYDPVSGMTPCPSGMTPCPPGRFSIVHEGQVAWYNAARRSRGTLVELTMTSARLRHRTCTG